MKTTPCKIAMFGLPGAGKGTQAQRLSLSLGIPHVSTGDMFRAMQNSDTSIAREIRAILASGQLVPDDMVTRLAFERLAKSDCHKGFILDGFPRTIAQAKALQESRFRIDELIWLEVDRHEIIRRLSGRRVCASCNLVTHVDLLAPGTTVCPNDGGRLEQRPDDQPAAVEKRLSIFAENCEPLIGFFEHEGSLRKINGDGGEEEVFARMIKALEGFRAKRD